MTIHPTAPAAAPPTAPAAAPPIAAAEDVLVVVAELRCRTERALIGALLHLDRSARGLPPMLLAELLRTEHDESISAATRGRVVTPGDRYFATNAVPVAGAGWPLDATVRLDCARTQKVHPVTVAELHDAGRRGLHRIRTARRQPGRRATPLPVDLDHPVSRWSPAGRDARTDHRH